MLSTALFLSRAAAATAAAVPEMAASAATLGGFHGTTTWWGIPLAAALTPSMASSLVQARRQLTASTSSTNCQDGWKAVTEATSLDKDCRRRVIDKLHSAAHLYKDHPPIEAINELLRQCSQSGPEMDNVHKLTQVISFTGISADTETYKALMANYTYFPSQGSDGPG